MSKAADTQDFIKACNAGHPGSIYSANQADVPEAIARLADDADLHEHCLVMGKTRDGMRGLLDTAAERRDESRATGLLAGLLRRI